MDGAGVQRFCLSLPAAALDHPFSDDHHVYKVGGKMFAAMSAGGGLSFKVSDIAFEVLTETDRAVPAPYLARARWVHLADPADWPDDDLTEHLATAHALIAAKLTKKAREALGLA
ncbi:MAG: MmcQ/YjbR family DNA-binding protein [Brevundimonas sp.]